MPPRQRGLADGQGSRRSTILPAGNLESYHSRRSDLQSDSAYGSLEGIGPHSVPFATSHAATQLLDQVEVLDTRTDSGFYSSSSLVSDSHEYLSQPDIQLFHPPSSLTSLATPEWLNVSKHVPPWDPGRESDPHRRIDHVYQNGWSYYPIQEFIEDSSFDFLLNDEPIPDEFTHDQTSSLQEIPPPQLPLPPKTTPADVTICETCGTEFTGVYRRGNCRRHVKQYHSKLRAGQTLYSCRLCKAEFRRHDAKRKHEWRRHRIPDAKPSLRKPGSSKLQTKHSTDTDSVDCESRNETLSAPSLSSYGAPLDLDYRIPAQPEQANAIFADIHAKLDVASYNSFCEAFISRWDLNVDELRLKGSDAYGIFAQIVQGLSKQLRPQPHSPHKPCIENCDWRTEPGDEGESKPRPSSHSNRGKGPAQASSSRANSRRHTSYNKRVDKHDKNPDNETITEQVDPPENAKHRKIDCPVHKHHVMLGLQSPCGGCGKRYISEIKTHLTRSKKHDAVFLILRHCERCQAFMTDDQTWVDGNHATGTCIQRDPPRGLSEFITVWVRLYLGIFPNDTRVPSPLSNDWTWLSDDIIRPLLPPASQTPTQAPDQGPEPSNGAQEPTDQARGPSNHTHELPRQAWAGQLPSSFLDGQRDFQNARQNDDTKPVLSQSFDLPAVASLETILCDALRVYARWFAIDHIERGNDLRPIEEIEDEYRARLEDLRFKQPVQHEPMELTGNTTPSMPPPPSVDNNTQDPSSDDSSKPGTRDNSSGFSSFVQSSQSSLLDDSLFLDNNNNSQWFLVDPNTQALPEPLNSPYPPPPVAQAPVVAPEPTDNARFPLLPIFDHMLDQPGPANRPQAIAQMNEQAWMQMAAEAAENFLHSRPSFSPGEEETESPNT
ncbi:hypothetical protein BKA66DRAFT_473124 [Pyrenochaeta sp. MPI-SDFR-AT-0127]|nr:hypothetical protein BKA66DRAFT_473124 [Pyrenochaeta sp. MPI-SDFR-AT-0127]